VPAIFAGSVTRLAGTGAQAQAQTVQAPRFVVETMWPKPLPEHRLLGSAVGLAVDARDHIYVLNLTDNFVTRTETGADQTPPIGECCYPSPNVLAFDAEGNLVAQWGGPGAGYDWPTANNGLAIDPAGNIWIGGRGGVDTRLLKFSRDGKFLLQAGVAGTMPAGRARGAPAPDTAYAGVAPGRGAGGRGRGGRGGRGAAAPSLPPDSRSMTSFGGPAGIAFDPAANEAFVADGYRNRRVAVIDMNTGAIKRFWGAFGNPPDDAVTAPDRQFGTPVSCVELSADGLLYVCDRSNNRIQVFRKDGAFVKEQRILPETRGAGSVWDVAFSRDPQQRFLYVADGTNQRVHVLDRQSLGVLTSFGAKGRQPGQFYGVHSLATDSRGNLYTVEDLQGKRIQRFTFQGIGAVTRNQGVLWPGR
jgi:DNA-binding beta-propeller fold protein YncE